MLKVGLTGGIGSGKTLVGKVFNHIGIPVFNADLESKSIINTDIEVVKYLKNKFGDDIYSSDGINRQKMASIIFNDKKVLAEVNSIIHPKVREYFIKWMKSNAPKGRDGHYGCTFFYRKDLKYVSRA